ncbi:N-acetyltransferase family protein [Labrys sp. ZIDIC5]|uniref:GNAT family N-acetyltransferase n=1 Tax=Labrys sedimenti TaxID=3106036 RepID=UPI002ACAEE74|nr:N-acetyltransferase family protein [Labrys sp. ZIDIC5]MDZ5453930.1 N-acetyltransferase family protein [Labrys sp. ZIDIC5]
MIIRPATPDDLPDILAIYNDAVLNSTAIWNWNTVDLANRQAWFDLRRSQGYPILVADAEGTAIGYASYGDWRPFDGYCHTVEHSIYVAGSARRRGAGAALLDALIGTARDAGKHVMLGGIEAGNEPSLALHRRFGFTETARMPEVGQKFGRWLDLVFMQKTLNG